MNHQLQHLAGKRILLLQGPVGPFFSRLAADLRGVGAEVFKVNFNAGDWLYFPRHAINYRGTMEAWPTWLREQLLELRIDIVFLFGDCRPIHQAARTVASSLGLEIGVFEEGYVRPNYVTLERSGVNGYSSMPRTPDAYVGKPPAVSPVLSAGDAYWAMVRAGFWYFLVGWMGRILFPHYEHHRPLTVREGVYWIRSAWRKHWFRFTERGVQRLLTGSWSGRFYLAPLQVFNDAQVTVHAEMDGVGDFIEETVLSFAQHAPGDTLLVFKHHPMDRGYRDYTRLIRAVAARAGVSARVLYIHDQHLPSLLDHARGVVLINSTVGLSALHHGAPTIVRGKALYDMPGLTYQGSLDRFWARAWAYRPNTKLYKCFRAHLIARTQVNGSFYRPLRVRGAVGGLVGPGLTRAQGNPPASGARPANAIIERERPHEHPPLDARAAVRTDVSGDSPSFQFGAAAASER